MTLRGRWVSSQTRAGILGLSGLVVPSWLGSANQGAPIAGPVLGLSGRGRKFCAIQEFRVRGRGTSPAGSVGAQHVLLAPGQRSFFSSLPIVVSSFCSIKV